MTDVDKPETVNGGDEENKNKPLNIDFQSIIAADVVISSDRRRRSSEKRKKNKNSSPAEGEDLAGMSDTEIANRIERLLQNFEKFGKNLPDKGARLKTIVEALKAELERRRLRRAEEVSSDRRRRSSEKLKKTENSSPAEGEDLAGMSDVEIANRIDRLLQNFEKFGKNLPDKGARLKAYVEALKAELEHRRLCLLRVFSFIMRMDTRQVFP